MVGAFVATTEFVDATAAQAASLGVEPAAIFVEHPIQDRTDDEMRTICEGAVDEILRAVTSS